jgi:molybdopterin-guanine dinucleotide biosynthesis protein A
MQGEGRARSASAIVLAGGRSSRMGRPKALLPFGGRTLIAHVVSRLEAAFEEIVVVAAPGQELPPLPATIVRDGIAFQGPVGGIAYGLKAAGNEVCFVTSCDAAFLDLRLVSHLLGMIAGNDVVIPSWDDRLQPLHAAYRKTVLPLLEEQLARGELRPIYVLDKVRTRRLDEDEVRRLDPEGYSFFNMNTPEEYERALAWLDTGTQHHTASTSDGGRVSCRVELLGVARLVGRTSEVPIELPAGSSMSEVFAALAHKVPSLVGRVIRYDRRGLVEGYACNLNGLEFIRSPAARVASGDSILILSSDAGG